MSHQNQNRASVGLPLPTDPEPRQIFQAIMAGKDGVLYGCDLWELLPQVPGIKKMPVSKPRNEFTYGAWVVFRKEEDGKIIPQELLPAVQYEAAMIRRIVAYGETCDKNRGTGEDSLPTVQELAEQLLS